MRPVVRSPGKTRHIVGPSGVEIVGALPAKLASPNQNASGLQPDGWIADASSFELTRPDAPSIVVIGGMVPLLGDPTFTTELRVLVDGEEVARELCGVGRFRLCVPVPQNREQWRFELRFSDVQHLPEPDGRPVAAQVRLVQFEAPESLLPPHADPSEALGDDDDEDAAPASKSEAPAARPTERAPLPPPPERIFSTETVIRPSAIPFTVQLREMWQYRHLFMALVWRSIRIEFDAMRLGSIWAVSRPLLFAAVFGFFRNLSGANTYVEVPYVPYVYSGLLLWTYFTDAATNAASAVRLDVALLSKIYYPRLLTPLVPAVSNLVTLGIGMVPLFIIMAWSDVHPGWGFLFLPVVILPCIIFALGLGLLVSALAIEDRDWERVLAFGLTIGLWIAPVIYSPEMIPGGIREIYHLNPMSGTLLGFRAVLFSGVQFPVWEWVYALVSSCAVFALGLRVFRSTELKLVDRL
jgi:lipopolysaccharide transport system permease protein